MRPNSRGLSSSGGGGGPPGSSGGLSGTGIRPGSGRKPPGTGRLRTGVASSGPGTQAAQGVALSASINVQDRPVTGQGVMGMRTQGNTGRLVEDASYYIGLLSKKIKDVDDETRKLRGIVESGSKESSQYTQLERKYEALLKNKEMLEGQLAEYNLALDKTRTSTDPEDVRDAANHLNEKNRQTGQELDRIFMTRKQREAETQRVEDQIEGYYREIQNRINELEPGKLRAYNDLMAKQREMQERVGQAESRLNDVNAHIAHSEADDKTNALRKEFANLERMSQSLRRDTDSMAEEVEIANLDGKEAHTRFVARVNDFKQNTKLMEDRAEMLREELTRMRKTLEDLEASTTVEDDSDEKKYELLVKRDQDMTAFMDKFDENRDAVLAEERAAQEVIVALLESLSRDMDESANMPSQDAVGEMQEAKLFKEKNIATAQRTMESLAAEKKKRERELDLLRASEPKLNAELSHLRAEMTRMRDELVSFQDIDSLRRAFDATQRSLQETKHTYVKRRDSMRQQVQALSMEHEQIKKTLGSNEVAKDIDDTEKRLRNYERSIFDLREFVETKSRETDFELVKENCLKMMENLNVIVTKKAGGGGGAAPRQGSAGEKGAQAKW